MPATGVVATNYKVTGNSLTYIYIYILGVGGGGWGEADTLPPPISDS